MEGNPIENICREGLALIKAHGTLFSLESQLAKQSIVPLLVSLGCAVLLLFSTWLTVLIATAYTLYLYTTNIFYSLAGTLLLQVLFLALTAFFIHQFQQYMSFKETRAHLKDYWGNSDEHV